MDAETHNIPPGEQSTDALWGMNRNGLNSTRGGGLKPKIRLSLDAPRVCAPELARFKISIKWWLPETVEPNPSQFRRTCQIGRGVNPTF